MRRTMVAYCGPEPPCWSVEWEVGATGVEHGSGGPEMISAVLFDMDGTLLETEELKALSYARTAVELRPEHVGLADVLAAFGDLVGLSREEVASVLMRRLGLEGAAREHMHEF